MGYMGYMGCIGYMGSRGCIGYAGYISYMGYMGYMGCIGYMGYMGYMAIWATNGLHDIGDDMVINRNLIRNVTQPRHRSPYEDILLQTQTYVDRCSKGNLARIRCEEHENIQL